MTPSEFETLFVRRVHLSKTVLVTKQIEYAGENPDVLTNFKYGAAIANVSVPQIALGYITKHLASVFKAIEDNESKPQGFWDEKLGDIVNYFFLIEAILVEYLTSTTPISKDTPNA